MTRQSDPQSCGNRLTFSNRAKSKQPMPDPSCHNMEASFVSQCDDLGCVNIKSHATSFEHGGKHLHSFTTNNDDDGNAVSFELKV